MSKKVFVLRIGDYRPDLCRFTIPTIKAYAEKIGAEYIEITERKHGPVNEFHARSASFIKHDGMPITFEKLQVHNLGRDSDWNILIDADIMLHPDMPDVTQFLPPDSVASAFGFQASSMFMPNRYFERDGRDVGIVGNFVVTTKLTHEVWDYSYVFNILNPADCKLSDYTKRDFIIDEYVLSHNLAKFGLKHSGILPMPLLTQMIVHLGNEERTLAQRDHDAIAAEHLYNEWKTKYPEILK